MIRNTTYQGLPNVVDSARAIGFEGRIILPSVVGADRSSAMIRILDRIKRGLQRNLIERELYLRASGLDYTIVRRADPHKRTGWRRLYPHYKSN
jgi:hypothetical protein